MRDGELFRFGSLLPGAVISINFVVKYAENVVMAIDKQLLQSLSYNLFYCAISGFMVGLFIGNITNISVSKKKLTA
jgi:hypothetical protein